MYIFNESRTVLDSCIKQEHFTSSSSITASSITGSAVIIYIIELNNNGIFQSSISINKLLAGYQLISDVGDVATNQSARASINCDPMVQCQQDKILNARAVARMVTEVTPGRFGFCTGTLINNEVNNGRPLFLTAFHCIDRNKNNVLDQQEIDLLAITNFQFRYWRTYCNGNFTNAFIEFTGAILRASSFNTDVVLLELINPPGIGDLVNYSGWNRQANSPSDNYSFIIHHPQTEDMRITQTKNVKNWVWNSNYWTAHYYSGTVDKGSSGSALLNEYGQIVGQLRSGWSNCNYTDYGDRYGKFERSWNNGGFQTWLSPSQSLQSTGLLNLTDIPINGPSSTCNNTAQFTTLQNLSGVTYEWSVTSGLQIISGLGTSSITVAGNPINNIGSGTLTLTLRSPLKGRTRIYTTSKFIIVGGNPSVTINQCIANCDAGPYLYASYTPIPGATKCDWYKKDMSNANNPFVFMQSSLDGVDYPLKKGNRNYTIRAVVTTPCGVLTGEYVVYAPSCTGLMATASPNPASETINLSLKEQTDATIAQKMTGQELTPIPSIKSTGKTIVSLFDMNTSGLVRQWTKNEIISKSYNFNIAGLRKGLYVLQVDRDNKTVTIKIIVE